MMATREIAPYDDNLAYLQQELEWIEARCKRLITERKIDEKTGDADAPGWSHYEEDEPLSALEARQKRLTGIERGMREHIDACLQKTREADISLSLEELVEMYGLDDFERTILLMASAVAFSRRFEEFYGDIQNSFSALTVESIFNFCELPFAERITRRRVFSKSGALVKNDLVSMDVSSRFNAPEDLLTAQVQMTNRTFGYLVGDNGLMDEFMEFSSVEEPCAKFDQVVLAEKDKERIKSVIDRHDEYLKYRKEWGFDEVIQYGKGALMLFYGKPGTGKTMMAHAVADEMGRRVLNVDIPTFLDHHDADRFLPALFREARLQNAILFFDECEVLFGDRRMGNSLMTMLLTEIERFEGVAILATNLPQQLDEALDRRILVKVRFPEPDRLARREIWQKHLPDKAPFADDVDIEALADRFEMTGGYIKNAVLTAVADAVHRNGDDPKITMDALERSARAQIAKPTDDDSPVVNPKVRLSDVILPDDLERRVEELIDAARHRRTILERWGVGRNLTYGKGVSALFYGAPGTGKTMCAEAIANELNRPLLVASVAGIKSKWIGQTERNLERLFKDARAHNAVLFLDEADSLLTARGEARASRHDDSVVNHLLTHIERHNGVVLLATNRRAELDPALDRRLTYMLEFPLPNAELRARIWQTLLPDEVPVDGALDFDKLGARFTLTGGLIKNAVFKAAFRAARADQSVTMALLEEAADEEAPDDDEKVVGFAG
ncbi:MAG: ATP-binding protein [Persicimonas sp.]